ncbi:WD40-repeat-containing domain protein [Fimicolochytrium jonesii]|uniref:WD40-repeat-containing domain protein n=1 Tax=Fimicolochytrium jonesii TaxID=1396493 RepID=UPI0022FE140F|nr:WD40-repeat-containing domain protein [Fimicolochytrium jonesii]KAI8825221.1 WD40-repeat-containing domain protein [Fimicolochytrium jonesii]
MTQSILPSPTAPPTSPSTDPIYTLRGHTADISALSFLSCDTLLASGDVEGNVIFWAVATRRPVGKWKLHEKGILAVEGIGGGMVLSHGRDDQLHFWTISSLLSQPDSQSTPPPAPTPTLTLTVNSLNFCSVSFLAPRPSRSLITSPSLATSTLLALPSLTSNDAIDVYSLGERRYAVSGLASPKTGMCMCLKLVRWDDGEVGLVAGYESGEVVVWDLAAGRVVERRRVDDEPVLSLDTAPADPQTLLTTTASTLLTKLNLDPTTHTITSTRLVQTPSKGNACVAIRRDGRVAVVGGWDNMIRVYGVKSMKQLAVLRAHRGGVQCVAFPRSSGGGEDADADAGADAAANTIKDEGVSVGLGIGGLPPAPANMFAAGAKDGTVTLWQVY